MKKIIVLFFLFPMIAFAGDIPFALMAGEEQALAIGQIVEHDLSTTIRLDVFLMGAYDKVLQSILLKTIICIQKHLKRMI